MRKIYFSQLAYATLEAHKYIGQPASQKLRPGFLLQSQGRIASSL